MSKYILSTYAIGTSYVLGSNLTNYRPDNAVLDTFWNLPRVDYDNGKSIAAITLVGAPCMVPIYSVMIPAVTLLVD